MKKNPKDESGWFLVILLVSIKIIRKGEISPKNRYLKDLTNVRYLLLRDSRKQIAQLLQKGLTPPIGSMMNDFPHQNFVTLDPLLVGH